MDSRRAPCLRHLLTSCSSGFVVGTSPGRLIETDAQYNIIHEWPEDIDGTLNILEEQFSPHGLSIDFNRGLMLTSDFVVPLTVLKPSPGGTYTACFLESNANLMCPCRNTKSEHPSTLELGYSHDHQYHHDTQRWRYPRCQGNFHITYLNDLAADSGSLFLVTLKLLPLRRRSI